MNHEIKKYFVYTSTKKKRKKERNTMKNKVRDMKKSENVEEVRKENH